MRLVRAVSLDTTEDAFWADWLPADHQLLVGAEGAAMRSIRARCTPGRSISSPVHRASRRSSSPAGPNARAAAQPHGPPGGHHSRCQGTRTWLCLSHSPGRAGDTHRHAAGARSRSPAPCRHTRVTPVVPDCTGHTVPGPGTARSTAPSKRRTAMRYLCMTPPPRRHQPGTAAPSGSRLAPVPLTLWQIAPLAPADGLRSAKPAQQPSAPGTQEGAR